MTDYTLDAFLSSRIDGREELQEERQEECRAPQEGAHQPIIGIPLPVQQGHQGPVLMADAVGAWAIERMRGRSFLIPLWPFPTHKHLYHSLWLLIESMDGLFLPAGLQGADWYSDWKVGEPGPRSWPICWEMALAQLATYIGMPILAVGEGAEKWNSALGGQRREGGKNPVQTIPATPETWERHIIRVRTHTTLASSLEPSIARQKGEQKPWELAFMPQQGVGTLAPGLRSCAQSEEGDLVAFERRDAVFGLRVLGRLDWGLDQSYGCALFEAFLHACQSFDYTRRQQSWEAKRESICATVSDLVMQGRPLLPVLPTSLEEKRPHARPLSSPSRSLQGSAGREPLRQRSHPPTKEERNRMRRHRLKTAMR